MPAESFQYQMPIVGQNHPHLRITERLSLMFNHILSFYSFDSIQKDNRDLFVHMSSYIIETLKG